MIDEIDTGINRNIFDRFNDFRFEIQNRILHNQNLLKYLKYTDEDPLSHPDVSMEEAWSMVGEKIEKTVNGVKDVYGGYVFFQPRTSGTVQDDRNMLIMNLRLKVLDINTYIGEIYAYFTVLVNYSNYEIIDGTARIFDILSCLYRDFGKSEGEWLGKMHLIGGDGATTPTNYHGYTCVFKISDFLGNTGD